MIDIQPAIRQILMDQIAGKDNSSTLLRICYAKLKKKKSI